MSEAKTITITVMGTNDIPVAVDATVTTEENTILTGDVPTGTDVDGTVVNYQLVDDVSEGSLVFNDDGSYSFTPGTDFDNLAVNESRDITFTYTATDNDSGVSEAKTITITVTGTNDAPVANTESTTLVEDGSVVIDVVGNDTDVDGSIDPTSVVITTQPTNGSLSVNAVTGEVTYTGNANYNGPDSFEYTVADNNGLVSSPAMVIFTVISPAIGGSDPISIADDSSSDSGGSNDAGFSINNESPKAASLDFASSIDGEFNNNLNTIYQNLLSTNTSNEISPISLAIVLQDQMFEDEGLEEFTLPENTFQHVDSSENIAVEATLSDGSSLPSYIQFDTESGEFKVDAEEAVSQGVDKVIVRVTGRDSEGNAATATFTITFAEDNDDNIYEQESSESQDDTAIDTDKVNTESTDQDQTNLNIKEADSGSALRLDQQLSSLGSGEFEMQKSQLLMDIKQLFG